MLQVSEIHAAVENSIKHGTVSSDFSICFLFLKNQHRRFFHALEREAKKRARNAKKKEREKSESAERERKKNPNSRFSCHPQ